MGGSQVSRVISGGQTGVDQAALRAAKACGLQTGGWAPLGWTTEDGPAPWLGSVYGLRECQAEGYPARNSRNASEADAMIWMGSTESRGFKATMRAVREAGRICSWCIVTEGVDTPRMVLGFLSAHAYARCLWVAGNRESINPGIGDRAERFLEVVFRRIVEGR